MADNPFTNFFSSLSTGFETGRERRTLLQRAQRGEIGQEEVPSMAQTIIRGVGRAAMTPAERTAQDQLKLQAARYSMENTIRQEAQSLKELEYLSDLAEQKRKLDQSMKDSQLRRAGFAALQEMFSQGNFESLSNYLPEEGVSADVFQELTEFRDQLMDTERARRSERLQNAQADLRTLGVHPDQLPTTLEAAERTRDEILGIRSRQNVLGQVGEMRKLPGARTMTFNVPGVGQVTVDNPKKEEVEQFTEQELATNIARARAALADLETVRDVDERAKEAAENQLKANLNMYEDAARRLGFTNLTDPTPQPSGAWRDFQRRQQRGF